MRRRIRSRSPRLAFSAALVVAAIALAACSGAAAAGARVDGAVREGAARRAPAGASPLDIATRILGHAPRGLAKTIVQRGSIIVANDSNYPPFSSVDESTGEVVGFDVDVARGIAAILGVTVEFRHPAWDWVSRGLVRGYYDVSIGSMEITPQRQKTVAFSTPYSHVAAQVLVRRGSPRVTGPRSLRGRKVGADRGSTYLTYLRDKTSAAPVVFADYSPAVRALLKHEVPMYLTSGVTARQFVGRDDRLALSGKALFWDRCACAVKKGAADLIDLLDFSVRKLRRDGVIRESMVRWFGSGDQGIRLAGATDRR
jgi:ABC-type amino acid transport substrate-binding protein